MYVISRLFYHEKCFLSLPQRLTMQWEKFVFEFASFIFLVLHFHNKIFFHIFLQFLVAAGQLWYHPIIIVCCFLDGFSILHSIVSVSGPWPAFGLHWPSL